MIPSTNDGAFTNNTYMAIATVMVLLAIDYTILTIAIVVLSGHTLRNTYPL